MFQENSDLSCSSSDDDVEGANKELEKKCEQLCSDNKLLQKNIDSLTKECDDRKNKVLGVKIKIKYVSDNSLQRVRFYDNEYLKSSRKLSELMLESGKLSTSLTAEKKQRKDALAKIDDLRLQLQTETAELRVEHARIEAKIQREHAVADAARIEMLNAFEELAVMIACVPLLKSQTYAAANKLGKQNVGMLLNKY